MDDKKTKSMRHLPFCTKGHKYSTWQIFETPGCRLVKRCHRCPKVLEVPEFLEIRKNKLDLLMPNILLAKHLEHISLF